MNLYQTPINLLLHFVNNFAIAIISQIGAAEYCDNISFDMEHITQVIHSRLKSFQCSDWKTLFSTLFWALLEFYLVDISDASSYLPKRCFKNVIASDVEHITKVIYSSLKLFLN